MQCVYGKAEKVSDSSSNESLFVNNCGYYRDVNGYAGAYRPFGRNDYHILFVANGELLINDSERLYSGGLYLFLPNDYQKYYYKSGDKTLYYWIHFSGRDVDKVFTDLGITRGFKDCSDIKIELEEIFRMIIAAFTNEYNNADKYAVGLLYSLLVMISSPKRFYSPYIRAIKLLNDVSREVNIKELANMYKMSTGNFIRSFKDHTGFTPYNYHIYRKIETAKTLLLKTDLTIAQIADSSGFNDPLYMSRVFKKAVGISPREYKKRRNQN